MFKRFLAFGLAALMLLSDVPTTAYAQTAIVGAETVAEMAEAPLADTTVVETPIEIPVEAAASDAIETPFIPAGISAENEVIETPFVPADSTAVDEGTKPPVTEDVTEAPDAVQVDETTYSSIVVNTPTSAVITADVKLAGYDEDDYMYDATYLRMYISTSETGFVNYEYITCKPEYEWDEEEQAWYLRYDYFAEENTTYYVKFCYSSVSGTQYGETTEITTLAHPEVTYTVEQEIGGKVAKLSLLPVGYASNREAKLYLEHTNQPYGVYTVTDYEQGMYGDVTVDEEGAAKLTYILRGDYNSTYDVKFTQYDDEVGEDVTVVDTFSVTTGSAPELTYAYECTSLGKTMNVDFIISGYRFYEEYTADFQIECLRYSTSEDMADWQSRYYDDFQYVESEDGKSIQVILSFELTDMAYETDYYLLPYGYNYTSYTNATLDAAKHKITMNAKVQAAYNLTYEMTSKTSFDYTLTVDGYASEEEYAATDYIECILYSTEADMSVRNTSYIYREVKELENGKIQLVFTGSISGLVYGTTYYVAPAGYNYTEGYYTLCTPVTVTTGAAPELTYDVTTSTLGRTAMVDVKIYGYEDRNEAYNYHNISYFKVSTSESMEDAASKSGYSSWDYDSGYMRCYINLSDLEYETDYYVVPVYYDDATRTYINATEVQKITTGKKKDVTYDISYKPLGGAIAATIKIEGYTSTDEYQAFEPITAIRLSTSEDMFADGAEVMNYNVTTISDIVNGEVRITVTVNINELQPETEYYVVPCCRVNYEYEPIADIQKVTTLSVPELSYDMTATATGNSVKAEYKISGYRDEAEYNGEYIEVGYSTKEDMSDMQTRYMSSAWEMEDGAETGTYTLYTNIDSLEYETDYYVAMVTYDYEQGSYVPVSEIVKATTGVKPTPVYNMELTVSDRNDIQVNMKITGYSSYNEYAKQQYINCFGFSETTDFTDCEKVRTNCYSNTLDGSVEILVYATISDVKYATQYYVAPMIEVYNPETGYTYEVATTPMSITTEANRTLDCSITATADSNLILADMTIDGYKDWNDYNNSRVYVQISKTEDFAEYDGMEFYETLQTDAAGFQVLNQLYYAGEPNTDYYIRAARSYRYAEGGWEALSEPVKVTTKEQFTVDAELELDANGTTYAKFNYEVKGMNPFISAELFDIYVSESTDFNGNYQMTSLTRPSDKDDTDTETLTGEGIVSWLNADTTYYARLVYRTSNGYVQVNDQTITFTTGADVEYEDSMIPDDAFRNAIKNIKGISQSSKLKKSDLETITYLSVSRDNVSQATIKDLTGIELMPCLETFYADYHEITDISDLSKVSALRNVSLWYNNISAIPDLTALTKLNSLSLIYNYIPESEFNSGKLPANTSTNGSEEYQRVSEELELVLAEAYYQTAEDVYPIQVEIKNTYPISRYTLCIYEGDTLLQKHLGTSYNQSWDAIAGWTVNEFATEAGERELTFVIYQDGEEKSRVTKKVVFDESTIYVTGESYQAVGESSYYVQAYIYGVEDAVTEAVLLDEAGTVVAKVRDLNGYNNSYSKDNRYSGIFYNTYIYTEQCYYTYGTAYYSKKSEAGIYDIRITMESGQVYTIEDALCVTAEPVLNNIASSYDYALSGDTGEFFVTVSGYNIPWDKVSPVLSDADGNVLSKVVEYKLTGESMAVYKLEKLADKEFSDTMKLELVPQAGITIIDNEASFIGLYNTPRAYYVEHIPSTEQVLLLVENVEEGVQYNWSLGTGYAEEDQVATCSAAVENGQVLLEFLDADGSQYFLQPDIYTYYVQATVNPADSEQSGNYNLRMNLSNYNYTGSSSSQYGTSFSASTVYVNDGSVLMNEGSYTGSLNEAVMKEDTVLVTEVQKYDKENGEWVTLDETAGTIKATQKLFTDKNEVNYWSVNFQNQGITFENGERYRARVYVDEERVCTYTIYVIDPAKPAYNNQYLDYYRADEQQISFEVRGYWPENLDESKLGIRLTDAVGTVLFEANADAVRTRENGSTTGTYVYRYLDFNLGDKLTNLEDYSVIYFEAMYDGEPIAYQRGETSVSSFSLNDSEAGFYADYPDNKYRQYFYSGIYKNTAEKAYTVKIYKPYDTEALKTIQIPAGQGEYLFTEADLTGLKYNDALERYDIILLDANGKVITWAEGYLQAAAAQIEVQSVSLNKTTTSIEVGKSETLVATIVPAMATDTSVSFLSSDPTVATVDKNGKVTALKEGTTTIVVGTLNGKTAACVVTVVPAKVYPESITLNQTELSMEVGKTKSLRVTYAPENVTEKSVTFQSADSSIAKVDKNGTVTAIKVGTTTITVTTANGVTASCTVTVVPVAATKLELNTTTLGMVKGNTAVLTATVSPANTTDKSVTFTSSDEAVVTVSAAGKLTAVEIGTATITAKTVNGIEATCTVTVVAEAIEPTAITLDKTELSLNEGDTATLKAVIAPENATERNIVFTSADESIATVDASGKVTAVKIGTTTITATTVNGKTAACTVKVSKKATLLDVKEAWKLTAAQYVFDKGIMNGTKIHENGDVTFSPDTPLKREMLATILYAAEGKPTVTTSGSFIDYEVNGYYIAAVEWSAANGIVSGIGNGKFGVGNNITREQLALMLFKYAEIKGYDTTEKEALTGFVDESKVNSWSREALEWAVANGVMSGKPEGGGMALKPQGEATRAECAAMLRSFMLKFAEE